jgi:hypothetical protein
MVQIPAQRFSPAPVLQMAKQLPLSISAFIQSATADSDPDSDSGLSDSYIPSQLRL